MNLKAIAQKFEALAAEELKRLEAAGIVLEQKLEAVAEEAFANLVDQLGPFIMQTITNLATAEFAQLSGSEKHNLAVTTVVDHAEVQGLALLAADATALVKNAYLALTGPNS